MKTIKKIFNFPGLVAIGYTLMAGYASAQEVRTVEDVLRILNRIVDYMFTFLLITSAIFIIIAAYKYLTAGADPERAKEAHKMIFYAVIAIAVGLLARSVEFIVRQLIGS